jgi:hypothetical protein
LRRPRSAIPNGRVAAAQDHAPRRRTLRRAPSSFAACACAAGPAMGRLAPPDRSLARVSSLVHSDRCLGFPRACVSARILCGAGYAVIPFSLIVKRGSGAPKGASKQCRACEARRGSCETRTPSGAPLRHFSAPGRACVHEANRGLLPLASSSHRGRSTPRAEPRRRPGAGLRDLPAGAASAPRLMAPQETPLEWDGI